MAISEGRVRWALTLTQPWASLVVLGRKRIETRSWSTRYRGALAIHAAKSWDLGDQAFAAGLIARGILPDRELPRGAVIGLARLSEVVTTFEAMFSPQWSEGEAEFGDFSDGRFAWLLEDAVELVNPQPAKGSLGIWAWRTAA